DQEQNKPADISTIHHVTPHLSMSLGKKSLNLVSFHPEMALFRNLCVNLRNHLCGVLRVRLRVIP
ncbi:MAG: hypothetical protein PVJ06_10775, partial [Desulfobacterales bacterium]